LAGIIRRAAKEAKFKQILLVGHSAAGQVFPLTDDNIAPLKPAKVLIGWYGSANKKHTHIAPADIGAKAINHFGFFKERFADPL
jgi:predicted alpha/beta hydrolase